MLGFDEKPRSEHWINGGFFCFERGVLDRLEPDSVLEREPLERLAAAGELRAFRHEGFWECMDTYKDAVALNELWASGAAPWRLWERGRGPAEPAAGSAARDRRSSRPEQRPPARGSPQATLAGVGPAVAAADRLVHLALDQQAARARHG